MKIVQIELGQRSYPIYIGASVISDPALYRKHIKGRQVLVVTNDTVAPLYLDKVLQQLEGYQAVSVILPDGEQFKNLEVLNQIFDACLLNKFGRNATLIALGGGVTGDMGGFAAACYQRGIPFIQVPTTLLAQVDSSVGGKTGVNHPLGKNMIGAFYQPQCVLADTLVLGSLDKRQLSAGLAEVIKYGLIRDLEFFTWLEVNIQHVLDKDQEALAYVIERSCRNKAEVVEEDETEASVRATLNLGHTFGHAIETGAGYGEILHGEAVAIGLCLAADLSRRMGWLANNDVDRIIMLCKRANLPVIPPKNLTSDQLIQLMSVDKKNMDGEIRLILLKNIGCATLPIGVDPKLLHSTLENYNH